MFYLFKIKEHKVSNALGGSLILSLRPWHWHEQLNLFTGNWDPSKVDIEDVFRATMIIQELGMLEEDSQILGARVLFDLQGITVSHAWHTTPTLAGKTLQLLEVQFACLFARRKHSISQSLSVTHSFLSAADFHAHESIQHSYPKRVVDIRYRLRFLQTFPWRPRNRQGKHRPKLGSLPICAQRKFEKNNLRE